MANILRDLWILDESGITLYNHVYDTRINEHLFGGLLTAINIFANEVADGDLTKFEIGSKRFTLLKCNKLLFVASSSSAIKEKTIQNELKRISSKFFNKYSNILKDWNNNTTIFSDFEKVIEDSSKNNSIRKFWDYFVIY